MLYSRFAGELTELRQQSAISGGFAVEAVPLSSQKRALTSGERAFAVAMGVFMLCMSMLSIVAIFALVSPVARLVEGLSK